jgi:hypothetical protein
VHADTGTNFQHQVDHTSLATMTSTRTIAAEEL